MARLTIAAINQRLKVSRAGVTVLQRGNSLYLYATLPPKPGKTGAPKQQQIALGIYANSHGLAEAEIKAKELSLQLARGTFEWGYWIKGKAIAPTNTGEWIESFKRFVFEAKVDGDIERKNQFWKERYWYLGLNKLNPDRPLTEQSILDVVRGTTPNTQMRLQCCKVLQSFAEFCGLEVDLKAYRGSYSASQVSREIPTDEEVMEAIDRVKSPAWRRVFAIMATYGLRDHEVWQCRFEWVTIPGMGRVLQCCVLSGKTGARSCLPLPQEWADRWGLAEPGILPTVTARTNTDYGRRTAMAGKRSKLGFKPYSLRHRYAIVGSVRYRFPPAVMAGMMGHSPTMHLSTYNKHLSEQDKLQAYAQVFGGDGGED